MRCAGRPTCRARNKRSSRRGCAGMIRCRRPMWSEPPTTRPQMKPPRHAAITIARDTAAYRQLRPEVREHDVHYLIDRLLAGEAVAQSALEHYGLTVTVREAVATEIRKSPTPSAE